MTPRNLYLQRTTVNESCSRRLPTDAVEDEEQETERR
jgi:hypothetical protein